MLRELWRRLTGNAGSTPSTTLPESRLVLTHRIFAVQPDLLAELRVHRGQRDADQIALEYDAFLLDGGLGPPTYITSDGRILWDDDIWDVKGTRRDTLAAIASGIHKTGIEKLRSLFPARPADAVDCVDCGASGRFDAHGQMRDVHGTHFSVVCMTCAGPGWTSPSMDMSESVLDSVKIGNQPVDRT